MKFRIQNCLGSPYKVLQRKSLILILSTFDCCLAGSLVLDNKTLQIVKKRGKQSLSPHFKQTYLYSIERPKRRPFHALLTLSVVLIFLCISSLQYLFKNATVPDCFRNTGYLSLMHVYLDSNPFFNICQMNFRGRCRKRKGVCYS